MALGILFIELMRGYKELLFITFDPEMARVSGLPAERLHLLLLSLMALTIALSIMVVTATIVFFLSAFLSPRKRGLHFYPRAIHGCCRRLASVGERLRLP